MVSSEGTGKPRRWAIQTPSGSIDAATSEAASIFFGVLGMIIEEMRITIVIHDRCPRVSAVGTVTQVLSMAIAERVDQHVHETDVDLAPAASACSSARTGTWRRRRRSPAISMTTAAPADGGPERQREKHRVHQQTEDPQTAADAAEQRKRRTCSASRSSGSRSGQSDRVPRAGEGVGWRGAMIRLCSVMVQMRQERATSSA